MSKIWWCATCGYEVSARGRCHRCKQRLVLSPLPELEVGEDEDEVGYRLDEWTDEVRGRLIAGLIDAGIRHRFEEEELVVDAGDEQQVDDLLADISGRGDDEPDDDVGVGEEPDADAPASGAPDADVGVGVGEEPVADRPVRTEVAQLADAARRLSQDPTDMEADAGVAEASAAVFTLEEVDGIDGDTWAAVGRVTRRLLAALSAEDAMEEEIRAQATILSRVLDPVMGGVRPRSGAAAGAPVATGDIAELDAGEDTAGGEETAGGEDAAGGEGGEVAAGTAPSRSAETVYELDEWLPEQRAELAMILDERGVAHAWDGGHLVVGSDREEAVEDVLDRLDADDELDADEEARYRSLEELFAATNRFVSVPADKSRRTAVVRAVAEADGPTPVGLDDAQWWQIRQRARTLADSIEHNAQIDVMLGEAKVLRDLLHGLM